MNQRIFKVIIHAAWNIFKGNKTVFQNQVVTRKKLRKTENHNESNNYVISAFLHFLALLVGHTCVNRIQHACLHFNKNVHQN